MKTETHKKMVRFQKFWVFRRPCQPLQCSHFWDVKGAHENNFYIISEMSLQQRRTCQVTATGHILIYWRKTKRKRHKKGRIISLMSKYSTEVYLFFIFLFFTINVVYFPPKGAKIDVYHNCGKNHPKTKRFSFNENSF